MTSSASPVFVSLRRVIDGAGPLTSDEAEAAHTALFDALGQAAATCAHLDIMRRKMEALDKQADDLVAQIVAEEARANRAERKNRELAEQIAELMGLVRAGLNENLAPVRWRARARAFLGEP